MEFDIPFGIVISYGIFRQAAEAGLNSCGEKNLNVIHWQGVFNG